jgi:general stress protein 26
MNDAQNFAKLIKEIKFAMLVTTNSSGENLRGRPMTLQLAEFDGHLWFFASLSSALVLDVKENEKVNLSFADVKSHAFVSASGDAEVVIDLVTMLSA